MNRDELQAAIAALPLFEKRDVWVQNPPGTEGTTKQTQSAICEIGQTKSWAYVGNKYCLIQFETVLTPVLGSVEGDIEGHLTNYGGSVSMTVFPKLQEWQSPGDVFGLVARNAVDLSGSIVVKFCVQHGPWAIHIPAKVAGVHKAHTGHAATLVKDYTAMIGQVQQAWTTIVTKFPTMQVFAETVPEDASGVALPVLCERLKLGQRQTLKLKKACQETRDAGKEYTLWDAFVGLLEQLSITSYKSGWHAEKALDKLCNTIFEYAVALNV